MKKGGKKERGGGEDPLRQVTCVWRRRGDAILGLSKPTLVYLGRHPQKTKHLTFRLFKLELLRKLPFDLSDVPKPDGTLSIEEYALYVDILLNKLPDDSIHMRAIPKRRASKEKLKTLLESLIEKGKLIKVVSNTFLVNYNH